MRFDLRSKESRIRFIAWCVVHGLKEYKALAESRIFLDAITAPAFPRGTLDADDPGNGISWAMILLIHEREDLKFEVETRDGRSQLLSWYLLHGQNELALGERYLAEWQVKYLTAPSANPNFSHLEEFVYRGRPDVQTAFPLPACSAQLRSWLHHFFNTESSISTALAVGSRATISVISNAPLPPNGVNIIGYAYGQLGIGEDARMAARALNTTNIEFVLVDFPPGKSVSTNELSMAKHVSPEPKYNVNLFCLTALEHGRYFAERGAASLASAARNIGYWPWELPKWPNEWLHLNCLADEIWVSTTYTARALETYSPPVRVMPMAVSTEVVSRLDREHFGLPSDATLFIFAFDLNSVATRKNPGACVAAFQKAFGKSESSNNLKVGLVIKVHGVKGSSSALAYLRRLSKQDKRVYLIEETLSMPDLLGLYSVCDVYISLHRAEGFGRSIAEAMLLGRPVIVTAFSGNCDFTSSKNAFMVKFKKLKLKSGDYPYGNNQIWADPIIEDAAKHMRHIVKNPQDVSKVAKAGQKKIKHDHSPEQVGRSYTSALMHIFNSNIFWSQSLC